MGAIAAAQVDKKCYKNQTAGNLGVVKLDHLGGQVGANVEPFGTVWLSDDEALLTARAPAQAKDNPFIEWEFDFIGEDRQIVQDKMVPLVLLDEDEADRHTPSADRPVPGLTPEPGAAAVQADLNLHTAAAVARDTERALAEGTDRPTAPVAQPSPQRPQAGTAVAQSPTAESWTENPERTEEPQPGHLDGTDQAVGASDEDPGRDGSPTGVSGTPKTAPTSVASSSVEMTSVASQHGEPNASESSGTGEANGGAVEQGAEEHAGVTSTGEETGAAQTPAGEAPEGEFAQHEEVGTPDAPAQGAES